MNTWRIEQGDSMQLLTALETNTVDLILTDPPYSSGGAFRSDRQRSTKAKYLTGDHGLPDFHGDSRTERGLLLWSSLWLGECWRIAKPGAAIAIFCDWRSLPTFSDALQSGGWSWRGTGVWVKPKHTTRPVRGGLWNDTEFILWGSKGARTEGECISGSWHTAAPDGKARLHVTEKPQAVLCELVRLAPEHGLVVDPFAGSGSTGVAAVTQSRRFIGFELSEEYAAMANQRLATVERTGADMRTDTGSLFGAAP